MGVVFIAFLICSVLYFIKIVIHLFLQQFFNVCVLVMRNTLYSKEVEKSACLRVFVGSLLLHTFFFIIFLRNTFNIFFILVIF